MNYLYACRLFYCAIFVLFNSFAAVAQTNSIRVFQDSKFEKLLNEKRKAVAGSSAESVYYRIQFFVGTSEEAKKILISVRKEFIDIEATIVFSTPNYKVVAGNFRSRIEAERNLLLVKKSYKNAFLLRPRK